MPEWTALCRAKDLRIEANGIEVQFGDGRRHRVIVEDVDEAYQVSAFVVRQNVVTNTPTLPIDCWVRNRATDIVGFRIDERSRLKAEAWIPKQGLTAAEFQLCVRSVAAEADRFEYVLTGQDRE